MRLILLGDSITAGYGVERGEPGYAALLQRNDTEAWPAWDGLDLTTTRPTLTQVIDVSQGGAKTGDVLDDQIREVKRQLGDLPVDGESLVVFTIGGNDAQAALFPGADATRIVDGALANLEHIIQALQDPGVFTTPPAIYATNIYEPTDGQGQARACFLGLDFSAKLSELDRYDAAFLDLAETYGFAAVDLHHHFLGHGYHSDRDVNPFYDPDDPTLWFASDCIHPNERGHHELRRLFWYAIQGEALPLHDL